MQIYNVYQSGKRLYIDEKENPDNKIVVNKYDNMQQTLRLISDGTLPPRLYWALRNPKLSNKYFILKLVNNEDLIVGTDISAYAGLWDMLLIGTDEDYIIEGVDIDQSRLTYVSDHFGRLFVRDNFLEELDFEEQCSPTFKVFYDEIMFQLDEKADTKDIPDKLSDFENDTNFISGFDTVDDGNGNVTIVSGVYGNFTFNIDSELSETSPRPVQNKVITSKINEIDDIVQENDRKSDEALVIAKGANNSLVYGNYSTMIKSLNAMQCENLKVGQNLLIVTLNVPDLWVSEVTDVYSNYEYVSDVQFVTDLADGTVQVGYFVLSPLETQKVDLSEYAKKDDYASKLQHGVVKVNDAHGLFANSSGNIGIQRPTEAEIDAREHNFKTIVLSMLDYAVMKALSDSKLEWTEEQKQLARELLGSVSFNNYPTDSKAGVVRVSPYRGLRMMSDGLITLVEPTDSYIGNRNSDGDVQKTTAVTLSKFDYALIQALTDGQLVLTDEEKAKALELLGGVAKYIPTTKNLAYLYSTRTDNNGNVYHEMFEVSPSAKQSTIASRGANGTLYVGTPTADSHATTKKYVDDGFVSQLSCESDDTHLKGLAYIVDKNNEQSSVEVRVNAIGGSVPVRDKSGNMLSQMPTYDWHCANKKYVDDLVGSVETILTELHTYAQTKIGGEA